MGSEDSRCRKLAELFSIAVDFPKSGTPVDARMVSLGILSSRILGIVRAYLDLPASEA